MEKFFKKLTWQEYILSIASLIYVAYFTLATFLKYQNYYSGRFDLGNMTQTVWNTIHGNLFMLTDPNGTREISRLAFHADFILILLSPLYLFWEDPRTLLFVQTLVLAAGGFFIYLIAQELLKHRTISLVFAICYFLNPAVNYVNLFDFHPVALATTFLLAAFYFTLKKNYRLVLLFLLLAGITKEEVWIINALFGLYLVFIHKQRLLGSLILLASGLIFYILIWIAIPRNLGGDHFALSFYSDYGDSPGSVIKNIFLSPIKTINTLLLPDRLQYVRQLFMPLGYLSFLAFPVLIFAAPDLGIDLLSKNGALHQIYYQYSSTITPFIFISAIYAVWLIRKRIPEIPIIGISIFLLFMTLISAYNYGPLPFAKKPQNQMFVKPLENREFVDSYIAKIPASLSICATNNLGAHLSHRRNIYVMSRGIEKADLVMYLMRNSNMGEKKSLQKTLNDPSYKLVVKNETFYVFKRN